MMTDSTCVAQVANKRKRSPEQTSHTRTIAACDACRVSKTRCDSSRPKCAQCAKRGRVCHYTEVDPSSRFDAWGQRILAAIEGQGRELRELADMARSREDTARTGKKTRIYHQADDDLELLSRKDVPHTPITAGDVILRWSVFPKEMVIETLPATIYTAKPNPYSHEQLTPSPDRVVALRNIFISAIHTKAPIIDIDQLDSHILKAQESNFDMSASTCLVLLVLAVGAFWGEYPHDERRLVLSDGSRQSYTVAAPETRLRESSIYFSMAQKRMSAAFEDDSLLGATCACMFGVWYQYNIEPFQGLKMFRTASMLWESYNLRHMLLKTSRSPREKSLEQRIYWTCLKAECEIRHEVPCLPVSGLPISTFPFPFPTFPAEDGDSPAHHPYELIPSSQYYFLAEVSLRRLLNRTRHAATRLSDTIDSSAAAEITETLRHLQDQLQQWLECLPAALYFNIPPDSLPAPGEPELIKLMRERYVEVCELLCRGYLYICLHGGTRLTLDQMRAYGSQASAGLRLSIYRIRTEKPFFRHAGSWIACRVRFNQALCLIAAALGKEQGVSSAKYVDVPDDWKECVSLVQERLEIWSDQGAGIPEMAQIIRWLLSTC